MLWFKRGLDNKELEALIEGEIKNEQRNRQYAVDKLYDHINGIELSSDQCDEHLGNSVTALTKRVERLETVLSLLLVDVGREVVDVPAQPAHYEVRDKTK